MKLNNIIFVLVLALLINNSVNAAHVLNYGGTLYRVPSGVPDAANQYTLPLLEKCNYPSEHEKVLSNVVDKAEGVWKQYAIYNLLKGGISCDNSAEKTRDAILPVLPKGWSASKVNSIDITNVFGGTSHVIAVINAPDGSAYVMDNYFMGPELTKMTKFYVNGKPYYKPAEIPKLFCWYSGYSTFMSNLEFYWVDNTIGPIQGTYDPSINMSNGASSSASTQVSASYDPNDIYGPIGYGDDRYVSPKINMNYTISFENKKEASLPAADINISNKLDSGAFDIDSFELGMIGFSNYQVIPPKGLKNYTTFVDLRPQKKLLVKIEASLNELTSTAEWKFTTLDPLTLEPPVDSTLGFLPPNVKSPEGEGFVSYSIKANDSNNTGDQIPNSASIVFDANAAIKTPIWINTIDSDKPESYAESTKAIQDSLRFSLTCASNDKGSGLNDITWYKSTNAKDYSICGVTKINQALNFAGEAGKTYSFYTLARDFCGNQELPPAKADITTKIDENAGKALYSLKEPELIKTTPISPTLYEYEYSIPIENIGSINFTSITAKLVYIPEWIEILDGDIDFGSVGPQMNIKPSDTIKIRANYDISHTTQTKTQWNLVSNYLNKTNTDNIYLTINLPEQSPFKPIIISPTTQPEYYTNKNLLNLTGKVSTTAKKVAWENSATKKKGSCKLSNGNWSASKIKLGLGNSVIKITAIQNDKSTNTTQLSVYYSDNTVPTIKIKSPTSKSIYKTTKAIVNISGSAKDNEKIAKVLWMNNKTGASGICSGTTSCKINGVVLEDGLNLIQLIAFDTSGNAATASITITKTMVKPK
jgi:hypothetical protein